ncbi:hypothetical protein AAIG96_36970, partial [Pseudomonas aeruginosa]
VCSTSFADAVASKSVRSSACCSNLARSALRIILLVIASRFPETEKPLPLKTEKCHNIGCLYSISGFLMALTAALKAQIAAWYKALQEQIPDFIP